jgi:hypothetical protein
MRMEHKGDTLRNRRSSIAGFSTELLDEPQSATTPCVIIIVNQHRNDDGRQSIG